MYEIYESPLSSRYASEYMLSLFSQRKRIQTWRLLWVELARAEHELGLPVSAEQVAELEAHVDDIDFACAAEREKEVRHDVMAHVYAYGKAAPGAAGIIHLGATSCYVTDNADLILYRDAMLYLTGEIRKVLAALDGFADRYKALASERNVPSMIKQVKISVPRALEIFIFQPPVPVSAYSRAHSAPCAFFHRYRGDNRNKGPGHNQEMNPYTTGRIP